MHCAALHNARLRILEAGLDSPVSSGRRNRLSGEALLRCGPFHRSFIDAHVSVSIVSIPGAQYAAVFAVCLTDSGLCSSSHDLHALVRL
jgi:hypothetical protein